MWHRVLTGPVNLEPRDRLRLLALKRLALGRSFAVTAKGHMTLVLGCSAEGDGIAVFLGVRAPFVVSPRGSHYALIGDAYVEGIVHGEALQNHDIGDREITLI